MLSRLLTIWQRLTVEAISWRFLHIYTRRFPLSDIIISVHYGQVAIFRLIIAWSLFQNRKMWFEICYLILQISIFYRQVFHLLLKIKVDKLHVVLSFYSISTTSLKINAFGMLKSSEDNIIKCEVSTVTLAIRFFERIPRKSFGYVGCCNWSCRTWLTGRNSRGTTCWHTSFVVMARLYWFLKKKLL